MKLKSFFLLLVLSFYMVRFHPAQAQVAPVELVRTGQTVQTFSTIQAGIDNSLPGDTVRIRGGTYFENLVISAKSGTASQPITLEGRANETVTIDAAYEPLTKTNNLWRVESGFGQGVYSATVPFLAARTGDETTTYATLADGTLLWTYSARAYFDQFFSGQGIYPDRVNNRVYIRLVDNQNPNVVPVYIARSQALYMAGGVNHWRIRNLKFRNGSYAVIFARGTGGGMTDVVFENLEVSGSSGGIRVWPTVDAVTIRNSTISLGWNFNWWWTDVKEKYPKTMEGSGISLSGVSNSEVAYNTITGYFNGIGLEGRNIDVHHNTITQGMDDGIEPEAEVSAGDEINNVRVHDNYISDMLAGIAMVPVQPGPLYVYRNTIVANGTFNFDNSVNPPKRVTSVAYKIGAYSGRSDSLNTKIYHNSAHCLRYCDSDNTFTDQPAVMKDWEWYNNIFVTKGTSIFDLDSVNFPGNVFSKNLWYPVVFSRDTAPVTSDPLFVNTSTLPYDLRIKSGSPVINAGSNLPASRGWPDSVVVTDGKPDIGAYEYVSSTQPDLKTILQDYLNPNDASYQSVDGKVNLLDIGWVVRWLVN